MAALGALVALAGLGSAPDAYQTAAKKRLENDQASQDALSMAAMGNALKLYSQQPSGGPGGQQAQAPQPGMPPPQPGNGPPGPQGPPPPPPGMGGPGGMPGGPTPPGGWPRPAGMYTPPGGGQQQPVMPGQAPQPWMTQPPRFGQPQPGQGMPPGAPPMRPGMGQPQPPPPPQMSQMPPQNSGSGGAPPGGGSGPSGAGGMPPMPGMPPGGFDWKQLIQQVFTANPGINPAVAASAVSKMLPFMNAASKQDWLMAHNQFLQQQLAARTATQERGQDIGLQKTREGIEGRAVQGDANRGAAGERQGERESFQAGMQRERLEARKTNEDANRALRKDIAETRTALTKNSQDQRDSEIRAATSSLTNLEKNSDAVEAYSKYAVRNGDRLLELAEKVSPQTGIPVVQRWVNAGRRQIQGDADVNNFDFQLRAFKNEVARILTNANITGQLTNQARSETDEFISKGASVEQLQGVFDTFKKDVDNRTAEISAKVGDIKEGIAARRKQLSETPAGQAPAASPTKTPVPVSGGGGSKLAPPVKGEVRDGFRFLGGDPGNKECWEPVAVEVK